MPGLPVVSGAAAGHKLDEAFASAGWRVDRQRGSHVIMVKTGSISTLSVPQHRDLSPGTLRRLIRAAAMTVEQFTVLL